MSPDAEPRDNSLLPVEWSSPWKRLRQDLARDLPAVLAATTLRLRELWRRNRDGDLSVPGFWPSSLAPLFWPLLLVLLLMVPVALLLIWPRSVPGPGLVEPSAVPITLERQLEQVMDPPQPLLSPVKPVDPLAPDPEPKSESQPGVEAADLASPGVDPLLELLQQDSGSNLVDRLHPLPEQGLIELFPSPDFNDLSLAARQQQADAWLVQLQEAGYERLELHDDDGRLLGRSAQVGSGMILWIAPQ